MLSSVVLPDANADLSGLFGKLDIGDAIHRSRDGFYHLQREDGHWVGELQGDTILESEFILLLAFLGKLDDPRIPLAAQYLLDQAEKTGGWSNYPGGPPEISNTVKAYFALKIAGYPMDTPQLLQAKQIILELGGAENCNSFTKFYLAMLGQFPYDNCPTVPPEMILLPTWFYFNLYAMSAWSRTIFVPLSIVSAYRPITQLPVEKGIAELFLEAPDKPRPPAPYRGRFSWTNFFLRIDSCLKWIERLRLTPFRRRAIRKATEWIQKHTEKSDGVGAIFPPMVYHIIVLKCLGVPESDPQFRWAMKQLSDLMIFEGNTLRLQPCVSPVWDTAISVIALCDSGMDASEPMIDRGIDWLLSREIRQSGDWSVMNPELEPTGWCFEYQNAFYPDIDDTAMVLLAISRSGRAQEPAVREVVDRAIRWMMGMQNRDGGWAAFDRDIDRQILEKVPFADHNAMLDPSCPDITARILEMLGEYGFHAGMPAIDRALEFIQRTQEANGSWKGRWGVNYIYGTWQVLQGLERIGFKMSEPIVQRAVQWLKSVQQPSGAWGESCRSYDDPRWAGRGEATPSQTAWAVLGLLAAKQTQCREVQIGIQWLLRQQKPDGSWVDDHFTGTGFPKVFYLKYHYYPIYFPLMAIARYQRANPTV